METIDPELGSEIATFRHRPVLVLFQAILFLLALLNLVGLFVVSVLIAFADDYANRFRAAAGGLVMLLILVFGTWTLLSGLDLRSIWNSRLLIFTKGIYLDWKDTHSPARFRKIILRDDIVLEGSEPGLRRLRVANEWCDLRLTVDQITILESGTTGMIRAGDDRT